MKQHIMVAKWILVVGGLLVAYQGVTGKDLIASTLGSLAMIVDVVVFGGAALFLAYHLLTMKKK
ncbi:MAG TPA: hypothetical protein VLE91_03345 [Candidatus Saccharimonadales bacterium]|nr:hypothetical protein [Candidatus Saccharimonadales bacterium]